MLPSLKLWATKTKGLIFFLLLTGNTRVFESRPKQIVFRVFLHGKYWHISVAKKLNEISFGGKSPKYPE